MVITSSEAVTAGVDKERFISIKAYNLNTILAEKIESILVGNVSNTRARDFYDVYILMTLRRDDLEMESLRSAIRKKQRKGTHCFMWITIESIYQILRKA